jgi:hypothetical protein
VVLELVWPAKIFEIKEVMGSGLMAGKLKDFRDEEEYRPEKGRPVNLVSEVLDLKLENDIVSGVFSKDFMRKRAYRREVVETPSTEEAPFWVKPFNGRVFLIVVAPSVARGVKKLLTNYVASRLSKVLFITPHAIVETKIPHDRLTTLHESNPHATRLIWFDQVDLPGVEKLCLAGSALADTDLYRDYLNHGKVWYVVFEAQERGITVGITRNSVVTLFSRSTIEEFTNYLLEDVLVLIE